MLEFKKRVLKFKWEGESYEVSFPTNRQLEAYTEQISDLDPGKITAVLINHLSIWSGISSDMFWEMEPAHVLEIAKALQDTKKK
jgi:hypothetical protein